MSLREDMAERLFVLWWNDSGNLSGKSSWLGLTEHERKEWLTVADEVIRIAEWARRECVDHDDDGSPTVPLTLPPDGWAIDTREPREPK